MANGNNEKPDTGNLRNILAMGITSLSVVGVITLAVIIILKSDKVSETATTILTAVLPLLGTWVGTVLAYYFSKENFLAATQSAKELLTPQEKLRSTPVKGKMIPKDQMHVEKVTAAVPASQITLFEMLERLERAKKGDRIPVLKDNDVPLCIIHRSLIDRFLTKKSRSKPPLPDLSTFTLQNVLDDADFKKRLEDTSFATVREDGTLADAKDAMDKTPDCQDVFVTSGGTKFEPVTGWITNVIIIDNARV